MKHQLLEGLLPTFDKVVPPARAPAVHEGLPRRVVLSTLDPDRARLILRDEHALDDVDVGRHPELLAAGLPAWLQLYRRSRHEDRHVHRGRESPERRDQPLDLDS